MAAIQGPVTSIDDIKERCKPILSSADFRHIAWVGVFGSFSRGRESATSDVDLLVGFKAGTTGDDIYYAADLKEPLQVSLQRDVDIIFMRNMQPLDFIRCQALLAAKPVYDVDTWLQDNRPRAEKLLAETHVRFKAALELAGRISKQLETMREEYLFEDLAAVKNLLVQVEDLLHALCSDDEDAKGIDSYFDTIYYAWAMPISHIIQRFRDGGVAALSQEDRQLLWQILSKRVPADTRALRYTYMPILEEALQAAGIKYTQYTD